MGTRHWGPVACWQEQWIAPPTARGGKQSARGLGLSSPYPPTNLQKLVVGKEEEPGKSESMTVSSQLKQSLPTMQPSQCTGFTQHKKAREGATPPRTQCEPTLRMRASSSPGSLTAPSGHPPGACWTLSGCPEAWGCSMPAERQSAHHECWPVGGRCRGGMHNTACLCSTPAMQSGPGAPHHCQSLHTLITPGARRVASMVFRHPRSTAAKRLASIGSCCWMSLLANTGSRYVQARCNAIHWSSTSETWWQVWRGGASVY